MDACAVDEVEYVLPVNQRHVRQKVNLHDVGVEIARVKWQIELMSESVFEHGVDIVVEFDVSESTPVELEVVWLAVEVHLTEQHHFLMWVDFP